jgi:hypothetical protein
MNLASRGVIRDLSKITVLKIEGHRPFRRAGRRWGNNAKLFLKKQRFKIWTTFIRLWLYSIRGLF